MKTPLSQYRVGKDYLYYFYRFVILGWELDWHNKKLLIHKGTLKIFCKTNNISIKSFDSADKLKTELNDYFKTQEKICNGLFWFVRKGTKPEDLLRHLRNCFAHGNFTKRQKNKEVCIIIENLDKGKIKAKGFLPINLIKKLIEATLTCKV